MLIVVHVTASPFFGGPERQMLGLGLSLGADCRSVYVSFPERGLCRPFLDRARQLGFATCELRHNAPRFRTAVQEVVRLLRRLRADVLCCHGYKPDLLGLVAARRVGVPVVSVSRGWTGCTLKVKVYDALDRASLRLMDAVVCVSEGQAAKVRQAGVPPERTWVIRNAIDTRRFARVDGSYRERLQALFPQPCRQIIGAAGRLSPEKGLAGLVAAAPRVLQAFPDTGLVIFGDGPLRDDLQRQIAEQGLAGRVILAGFRGDLDHWLAALDVFALPSLTEGLPNVVLEAFAAGVPVVATNVGGTPEVVEDGVSGFLVPAGDPEAMARRLVELLADANLRQRMGQRGRERVRHEFTFAAQAEQYRRLFGTLVRPRNGTERSLRLVAPQ